MQEKKIKSFAKSPKLKALSSKILLLDVSAVLAITSNSSEDNKMPLCPIVFTAVEFKLQNYTIEEEQSFSTAVKLLTLRKWQNNFFYYYYPAFKLIPLLLIKLKVTGILQKMVPDSVVAGFCGSIVHIRKA